MKSLLLFSTALLLSVLVIAVVPTEAEAKIYEDTVRLHILANSDSEEDQALKLFIRDKILEKYGVALSGEKSAEDAINSYSSLLQDIEKDCEVWIKNAGYGYSVKVTLTEEWYDTRAYEDFTLPSGNYYSLRVIIGEGAGKNWWCVMYPPLCTDIATENSPPDDVIVGYSENEVTLITEKKYNVKFKSLELLSKVFYKK